VFILFQDKLFTVNFTHKFIDGLNVTGVVNRIVLHRDLFNQELWSLDSNFRFRFRASNFLSPAPEQFGPKNRKTLYYLYNSLELEPRFPAKPSKKFLAPSPQPWFKHLFHHSNCIPTLLGDSDATGGLSKGGKLS